MAPLRTKGIALTAGPCEFSRTDVGGAFEVMTIGEEPVEDSVPLGRGGAAGVLNNADAWLLCLVSSAPCSNSTSLVILL